MEARDSDEWATRFAARYWTDCRYLTGEACMALARSVHGVMGNMDPFTAANLHLASRTGGQVAVSLGGPCIAALRPSGATALD
jgi:leucyl aminopeptidase